MPINFDAEDVDGNLDFLLIRGPLVRQSMFEETYPANHVRVPNQLCRPAR
jgi:hypothetical protein